MYLYKRVINPGLWALEKVGLFDSEWGHVAVRSWLHRQEGSEKRLRRLEKLIHRGPRFTNKRLAVSLAGIPLDNPLLVGAGLDKIGVAVRALYVLGFAGVEIGSVLDYRQPGNPKPRQFMITPRIALNRLGFNGPGKEAVDYNLMRYAGSGIPIGINVGMNSQSQIQEKVKDPPEAHAAVVGKLYRHAVYFVINPSSPNTLGLRALQDKKPLTDIVQAVVCVMEEWGGVKPVFVKIAPDLTLQAVDDVIDVVIQNKGAGIIASNTTSSPDIKRKYRKGFRGTWRDEPGGLSGDDEEFRQMSNRQIEHIYKTTNGALPTIGVGGVIDSRTAREKIEKGAHAVQIVTGLRTEGLRVAADTTAGLAAYMDKTGVKSIEEMRGAAVKN